MQVLYLSSYISSFHLNLNKNTTLIKNNLINQILPSSITTHEDVRWYSDHLARLSNMLTMASISVWTVTSHMLD